MLENFSNCVGMHQYSELDYVFHCMLTRSNSKGDYSIGGISGSGSVSDANRSDFGLTLMFPRSPIHRPLSHYFAFISRSSVSHRFYATIYQSPSRKMAKKKNTTPGEEHLLLPTHPARVERPETEHEPTVDTHTHLLSTFTAYQGTYKPGKHQTIWEFVRNMYHGRRVEAIVDVWCEAPVRKEWKEIANSALSQEQREKDWGGIEYWFVMGE